MLSVFKFATIIKLNTVMEKYGMKINNTKKTKVVIIETVCPQISMKLGKRNNRIGNVIQISRTDHNMKY